MKSLVKKCRCTNLTNLQENITSSFAFKAIEKRIIKLVFYLKNVVVIIIVLYKYINSYFDIIIFLPR